MLVAFDMLRFTVGPPGLDTRISAAYPCGAMKITYTAIAKRLGVTKAAVSQWFAGQVPIPRAVEIEQIPGSGYTRRDMRPDDWWLIWPELVTDKHPIPTPSESA